jgi:hypothetical protein
MNLPMRTSGCPGSSVTHAGKHWQTAPTLIASFLIVVALIGADAPQPPSSVRAVSVPAKDSSAEYDSLRIEGWTVLVNKAFTARLPQISDKTLTELRAQLNQIVRRVPTPALKKLRTIRIWVEENEPSTKCMAYHPGADWLRQHGVNPAKAGCVELANARNFLSWTIEQPWMILHELAHAYHHKFLDQGFDNPEIKSAFQKAKKKKQYDNVLYFNGNTKKAYALENPMEYFAEATEAYFGTNDYYPFVRAELQKHDPDLYRLLEKIWSGA